MEKIKILNREIVILHSLGLQIYILVLGKPIAKRKKN